jgi:hypothetical protein
MNEFMSTFLHGPSKRIESATDTAYFIYKQDSQNGEWPPRLHEPYGQPGSILSYLYSTSGSISS